MKLRYILSVSIIALTAASCQQKAAETDKAPASPLTGTWHLISSKSITKGDTTVTTPSKEEEMVKIFNGSDFAFFTHDLKKGKVDKPVFSAGSGTYTLQGDNYAEHLAYCNARDWEGGDFKFTVEFKHDTLIQKGIEKIDSLKIDHEIIETYVKLR
jgi:hypothetical protein